VFVLAVFVLAVLLLIELLLVELPLVELVLIELPLVELVLVELVLAGDVVVTVFVVTVFVTVFVTVLLAFDVVLLVFVLSPAGQAAPNKPNVKTAERAITFFISIIFSCLLQRMLLNCLTTVLKQSCPSNLFWNNGQYKRQTLYCQPRTA
jgi:hypothetical protein